MNKIRILFLLISLVILTSFLIISCSYHEGVYLKNNTKHNLVVKVIFETENGNDNLDFILKPGEYDAWEYEAGYSDREMIDKNISKVTIEINNGCKKTFTRAEFSKLAVKRGMWEIHFDEKLIICE